MVLCTSAASSSCCRNSFSSLPRSPIRPNTITSAAQPRAMAAIRVVLPEPGPAKTPIRWPRPSVSSPSIARIPVDSGLSISGLSVAWGAAQITGTVARQTEAGAGASGTRYCRLPKPSSTPPNRCSPTSMECDRLSGSIMVRLETPSSGLKADRMVLFSVKPTTSANIFLSGKEGWNRWHISPISVGGICASISVPSTCDTRPRQAREGAAGSCMNQSGSLFFTRANAPSRSRSAEVSISVMAHYQFISILRLPAKTR